MTTDGAWCTLSRSSSTAASKGELSQTRHHQECLGQSPLFEPRILKWFSRRGKTIQSSSRSLYRFLVLSFPQSFSLRGVTYTYICVPKGDTYVCICNPTHPSVLRSLDHSKSQSSLLSSFMVLPLRENHFRIRGSKSRDTVVVERRLTVTSSQLARLSSSTSHPTLWGSIGQSTTTTLFQQSNPGRPEN